MIKPEEVSLFCKSFSVEPTIYGGTYWTGVHLRDGVFYKTLSSCGSVGDKSVLYIHGEKTRGQIEKEILDYFK